MNEIIFGFLVLVGTGTVGLAVRDLWDALRSKMSHGRRREDMRRLKSHYEAIEAEWDEVGEARKRLEAKKGGP